MLMTTIEEEVPPLVVAKNHTKFALGYDFNEIHENNFQRVVKHELQ